MDDGGLFSSDYPHEVDAATCKHELQELEENEELSDDDKDAILFRNAQRFYRLGEGVAQTGGQP